MNVSKDFFEISRFVKSLNSTFILMVPKKSEAEDLKDFRPITLTNSLYKLIAKVFANRWKSVTDRQSTKSKMLFLKVSRWENFLF